jgi:hypothetical protein
MMTGGVRCTIPAGQARSAAVNLGLPRGGNVWGQADNPAWAVCFVPVSGVWHLSVFRVGPVVNEDETCLVRWVADVKDVAA